MKISETLWQCYKDHSVLTNTGAIVDFNSNNISDSFNLKKKTSQTGNDRTKDVETMVPLKYQVNFWRTPK